VAFQDWIDNPMTWIQLADHINTVGKEPLIARDCYAVYIKRVEYKRKPGQTLVDLLDIEICMKIAKNFAQIQEYSSAINYAKFALEKNHFHAEARRCLMLWSNEHKSLLVREETSMLSITKHWKERAWTKATREQVKKILISDLEVRLQENRFDSDARKQLAYYDRIKVLL
jgi:hypothetical protein